MFRSRERGPDTSTSSHIVDWIREIQSGRSREGPFRDLFRHYFPSVVYFFVGRGFSKEDAEDLAQDVLMSVYKNVAGFRFESSFETWLYQILTNVWKNALRSRSTLRSQAEKASLDEVLERTDRIEPHDEDDSPLEKVMDSERHRLLQDAMDRLPPKMRQCIRLRAFQGLRYREIAEVMGISTTTVKTQLQTANLRLKPLLEEHVDLFFARGPG